MVEHVKPEAFFDSLSLAHKLDDFLDGFGQDEIHLFSYFASILFLFRGNNVSDWGCRYTINENGYPFSSEINEAVKRHIQNGWFEQKAEYYIITTRGTDEYNTFKVLSQFQRREEYLGAACSTTILVPYAQTLRALLNEPEIAKQRELEGTSWLEQSNIYEKFKEISNAVGVEPDNLLIPAVNWVNYLFEKEKASV